MVSDYTKKLLWKNCLQSVQYYLASREKIIIISIDKVFSDICVHNAVNFFLFFLKFKVVSTTRNLSLNLMGVSTSATRFTATQSNQGHSV